MTSSAVTIHNMRRNVSGHFYSKLLFVEGDAREDGGMHLNKVNRFHPAGNPQARWVGK